MGAFVVCGSVLLCKSASTGGMSGSLEKREEMCPPPRPRGVPPPTDSPRPPPRPCAGPPVVTRLPSTTRVPRLDFLALRCSWSLAGPREPAVVEESLNASSKVVIPVHGTMCSWMSLPQEARACYLSVHVRVQIWPRQQIRLLKTHVSSPSIEIRAHQLTLTS